MEVFVRVKAVGKVRDILAPVPYSLPDGLGSLRQVLSAIVAREVARYNRREPQAQLIPYLTRQQIEAQAEAGKVSFGRIWSDRKTDPQSALENAIQCWRDGLVRVLMNDTQLTDLDAPLAIPQGAVFTFLRLTFLTGTMW